MSTAIEQPYVYRHRELVEPDWTRFPGWRDVTATDEAMPPAGAEFTRAFYADPIRRYMLPVFSDRRTDWPSHPHATHMSCSCRLSRVAWGCDGQSVRRSENTGSM